MNSKKIAAIVGATALAAGGLGAVAATAASSPSPSNLVYNALTPTRLVDTRTTHSVSSHSSLVVNPNESGASAVVLNVTATGATNSGNLTVDPDGVPETGTSNVNFASGQTQANEVTAALGADGNVAIWNNSPGSVQIIVDLEGYYTGSPNPGPTTTSPSPTATTPTPTPTTPTPTPTPTPTGTSTGFNPTPLGMPGNFTYTGGDEFNGTALNTNMWTPGWFGTGLTGPVNSGEHQGYDSANVTEPGDGTLHLALTATKGSLVSSNTHFSFTSPGAYEARVYLPGSGGDLYNWPAAWTDGQSWPANGEIDAMEGLGTPDTPCFHVHTSASPNGVGGCPSGDYTGWHTYGFQWTGTTITFYYDGVNVGSEPYSTGNAPQYLIFDNTSSGTPVPDVMQVDYVRVWSSSGSTPTPTPTTTSPTPTPTVTTTTPTPTPTVTTTSPTPTPTQPTTPPAAGSAPAHTVVLLEENQSLNNVVGDTTDAPYLNSLASQGTLYTDDTGKSHPSLPNYLDLYSGSTQGQDGSDNCILSSAPNIATELGSGNVKEFAENLPSDPTSNSGNYACRHNPAAQFTDSASKAAENDFSAFPTTAAGYAALPKLSYVTPNLIDDGHTYNNPQSLANTDAWAKANIDSYAQWAKANHSVLIVTWDENLSSNTDLTTPLPMFIVGAGVPATTQASHVTHDSVLRTIENWYGASPLADTAAASSLPGLPSSF